MNALARRTLSAASLVLVVPAADAQVRLDWTSLTQSAGARDEGYAIVADAAGNTYSAGLLGANSINQNGTAFVVARDPSGGFLWSASYDSPLGGSEFPTEIALDGAGGVYVAGYAATPFDTTTSAFLFRAGPTGGLAWAVVDPQAAEKTSWNTLVVDALGRAIVGGRARTGQGDLRVAAYATSGALAWERVVDGSAGLRDEVAELAIAPNGEILAVGFVGVPPSGGSQLFHPAVLRLAADGTVLNLDEVAIPEGTPGALSAIAIAADGRYFVGGSGVEAGVPAMLLMAYDASDLRLWTRTIPGGVGIFGGGATVTDMAIDPFGRAVAAGWKLQGTQGARLVVGAWDAAGSEVWRRDINDVAGGASSNRWNIPVRLLVAPDGESIVVGSYGPPVAEVADLYALGFDTDGATRFSYLGLPPVNDFWDFAADAALVPGNGFVMTGRLQVTPSGTGYDAFVMRFRRTSVVFCLGDGSSGACPCANESAPVDHAGCRSSLGVGGELRGTGASSITADQFALLGSSMPSSQALYFQAQPGAAPVTFGDGRRCASGSIVRLGTKTNVAGGSRYPEAGDPSISVAGAVLSPGTRAYQVWYRNAAAFCTPSTFNLTNGLLVDWAL